MHEGRRHTRRERGTTTLEAVGLAVAIAGLLGAVATSLGGSGAPMGDAVAGRMQELVAGDVASLPSGRRRTWHERRREGGTDPVRVPRDELRMDPVIDPHAMWSREWQAQGAPAGIASRADVRACAMCTRLDGSWGVRSGAGLDERGGDVGFEGTLRVAARIALASIDASVRARHDAGPVALSGQLRGRATVGADAEGEAKLRLSTHAQELDLDGTAAAGAVARGEARMGVDVLGVAIRQGARAEGWAGAGARGTVGVRHERDRVSWRFGWGGALGLGGAAEWSGSIDVTRVPRRHREVARAGLASALRVGPLPVPLFILP
jgi:hypothetical protein